jgi:hypothetical protein
VGEERAMKWVVASREEGIIVAGRGHFFESTRVEENDAMES